jgi:hypothetical protein
VLRWQLLFHKAFGPVVVSAYAVVVGIIGIACGYFAENIASHLRPTRAETPITQERKASRVEVWLKAQTVAYERPVAVQAEPEELVSTLPVDALQRPVRHAAEMAAALDSSESVSLPSTGTVVAAEQTGQASHADESVKLVDGPASAEIRESAESTTVNLALAETLAPLTLAPVESAKPVDSAPIAEGLKSVEPQSVAQSDETIKPGSLKRAVKTKAAKRPASVAAKNGNLTSGEKSKLASVKLRKMPKPLALAKTVLPAGLGTAVIRARFADTPSEIIRRSLMGTG